VLSSYRFPAQIECVTQAQNSQPADIVHVDKAHLRSLSSFSVSSSCCRDRIEVQVYEALAFKALQPPFSTIGTNGTKVSLLALKCSQLMVCERCEKFKP